MIPGAATSLDTAADAAAGVLAFARGRRAAADAAEADLLRAACSWADLHPAESIGDAVRFGDTPVPVAAEGSPAVDPPRREAPRRAASHVRGALR